MQESSLADENQGYKKLQCHVTYFFKPISGHCSNFIPPESVKKPLVFCYFQGLQNENIDQK